MAILDILTYPEKSLLVPSVTVETIDNEIKQLIENMGQTMFNAPGVGLAAPQVGVNKRIIVYDSNADNPDFEGEKTDFTALINPQIIEASGSIISADEGCLSVVDLNADVNRYEKITVTALDIDGNKIQFDAKGILAVIMALPVLLVIIAISGIAPNLYFNHHNFFGLEPEYRSPYDRVTWSYIHIGYSLIYFIAGTVLVIRRINRNPNVSALQSIIITLGMLVPWIGNITFIFRVSPIQNLDLAPFAFTLSGVLLAWGLFYGKLVNVLLLARQTIMDRMADGLIVLDTNDWIVDMNPAAQSIFRIPASRATGVPLSQVFKHYPDLMTQLQYTTRKHEEIKLLLGGQEQYFDLTISPLFGKTGALQGKMVLLHEITTLKQTENKLKEAKNRAESADNLKSAFLANMSHEIRTPMNAIIGFSNLLNDPGISVDEREEFIQHIRSSGNSLLQLIDDIIDISKLDSGQIELKTETVVLKSFLTELFGYYNEKLEEEGKQQEWERQEE